MEQQIKALARKLLAEYIAFFVITAAFAALYELNPSAQGFAVGNVEAFVLNTACILLTLALVPLSLKLFNVMLLRHKNLPFVARLRHYRLWSATRLITLGITTIFDLWVYYATLDNIGGFCALICLVAALFCCPTRERICSELEANEQ